MQLEEQGEWEETWEEYNNRIKRRREWDERGWELQEIVEEPTGEAKATTSNTAGLRFPQEHLGGPAVEVEDPWQRSRRREQQMSMEEASGKGVLGHLAGVQMKWNLH